MPTTVKSIPTTPFADQKPGTSGLRKPVQVFMEGGYLENFVQSIFNAIDPSRRGTLVLGGDGRFFNREAAAIIIRMAAANGFNRVIVGRGALLSTPALSNLIRLRRADGGIVLSASHNPGGPQGDFGIKFNNASGAPAPESVTERIYSLSRHITEYHIVDDLDVRLDRLGEYRVGDMQVDVVDPVDDYQHAMESCFDFDRLRAGFADGSLSVCFDAMHAITGPYARRIFEQSLGAAPGSVINGEPLEDFGGGHPDPNLANAPQLVERMFKDDAPVLGAASDGDGDRNLILGKRFFVGPSDSLALLAAHAREIPRFSRGLNGVARSMPTSRALDRVARYLGIDCYETPTGWKYFGNLLDAGLINLCGEESFGTGGDHVREKDGLWAVLAWLTLIVSLQRPVGDIVKRHWGAYGRDVYCRHDYEGLEINAAHAMMEELGDSLSGLAGQHIDGTGIRSASEFRYRDPVDEVVTGAQGIQVHLEGDARIVYRLSGTGTSGATLRVYLERYQRSDFDLDALAANVDIGRLAALIADIPRFTGRHEPTLRT
jgi:phosphoglucomutase